MIAWVALLPMQLKMLLLVMSPRWYMVSGLGYSIVELLCVGIVAEIFARTMETIMQTLRHFAPTAARRCKEKDNE